MLAAACAAAPAEAAERRVEFAIAAQPLQSALVEFSRQSGALIVVDPALVRELRSVPIRGRMVPRQALERLLRGSGLRGVERSGGGFLVQRAPPAAPRAAARAQPARPPRVPAQPREPVPAASVQADIPRIVVTARRREEALADVPLAMSVVERDRLDRMRVHGMPDLARLVPGVELRDSASNKDRSILIRGVGTVSTSPGVEPSISIIVDDVLLSRPGQAMIDLQDIERVELIKGPQVTLFGKNASAGVLNIVTNAPRDEADAAVLAEVSTDRERRVAARLTGPIGTTPLRYALSGVVKRFPGNQVNLATGLPVNGMRREGFRAKLQAGTAAALEATLSFDYFNTRENVPNGSFISASRAGRGGEGEVEDRLLAAILAEGGIAPSRSNANVRTDTDSRVADENFGGAARIDAALPTGGRLTSITAFRRWDNDQVQDYDGVDRLRAAQLAGGRVAGDDEGSVRTRQFSQELRLTGEGVDFGDFIVGLYFLDVDTSEQYRRWIRLPVGATIETYQGVADFTVNSRNMAAFGEAHLRASDRLTVLAGLRVLYDQLEYGHARRSDAPPGGVPGIRPDIASRGRTDRADWAGRVGLQYTTAALGSVYATLSRGYKGPAYSVSFNMIADSASPLAPETSVAWEAGAKGTAAEGRITYDLALFWTDFSGFQTNYPVSFLGITSTRLINAGPIRSRGIEFDARLRPSEQFLVQASAALLDARVRRFNCPAGATCQVADGARLPYAPTFKASVDGSYRLPLGQGIAFELGANATFRGRTAFQLQNSAQTSQPASLVADAFATLELRRNTRIRLSVSNIFNERYSTYVSEGNVSGTIHYLPRNFYRSASIEVSTKI